MMLRRALATALLIATLPIAGLTQSGNASASASSSAPSAPPTPVVADVHPSPHSFWGTYFRHLPPANGRFTLQQGTLLDLITTAYGVDHANVVGGPSWLDYDRFDVIVKVPPDAKQPDALVALRSVLVERFKLVSHTDMRPLPALLLREGSGAPKLKPAADTTADSVCQFHPSPRPAGASASAPSEPQIPASYSFSCHNMTMAKYAENLRGMSGPDSPPVVDLTGIKGAWDFDVTYALRPDRRGYLLPEAVEKQLGLKIESGTTPQPVFVVESAIERPTANSADLEKLLPPPPPPEFEVAVITPTTPGATADIQMGINGSQVIIKNATLQAMISRAWDISGAMIAEGPAWFSKDRWDITAKVPADAMQTAAGGQRYINFDDIKPMLRTMLAERFLLKAHTADHLADADAFTLYAAGPKMKKADPTSHTLCKNGPGPDGKDPRTANPILSHLLTCQNVTMDQFAAEIQYYALDYIKTPVLNSTKLAGSYDLTLSYSGRDIARGKVAAPAPVAPPPTGDASTPSDPTGAISLQDALQKQLGLKLVEEKRPVPMLVIDHLEQKPTDN